MTESFGLDLNQDGRTLQGLHGDYILSDWEDQISQYKEVKIIDADHASSNYNNHQYLVEADGERLLLYKDDSDIESPFHPAKPMVSNDPEDTEDWYD